MQMSYQVNTPRHYNMDRQQQGRKEARTGNSGFKKLAVHWLIEVQFSNKSFVVADSFVLRNRQLFKPANRQAVKKLSFL